METSNKQSTHLHTLASFLVILAACLWGILVIFVRAFGQADFKSMEIVTLRVYSSAIFLWLILIASDRIGQRNCDKNQYRSFHLNDTWCFVGTGLVSIVFFVIATLEM